MTRKCGHRLRWLTEETGRPAGQPPLLLGSRRDNYREKAQALSRNVGKKDSGYSIVAQPIHAESLAKHFRSKLVSFARQGKGIGSEDLLQFSGRGDGESLGEILQEWKEKYVSGGEQYL